MRDRSENEISHPVIYFDGYCKLCNFSVSMVIKYDRHKVFRYAHLSSTYAQNHLLSSYPKMVLPDSVMLQLGDQLLVRSAAIFAILEYLEPPLRWLRAFRFLPSILLDAIYIMVSRVRYRVLGRLRNCPVPDASVRHLFLD